MSFILKRKGKNKDRTEDVFSKKEVIDEKLRKIQITYLTEKFAMYRNNIESAKMDLEEYEKLKDNSLKDLTQQLKDAIKEWEKRLNETKEKLASIVESESEIDKIIEKTKQKIKTRNFIENAKKIIKASVFTFITTLVIVNLIGVPINEAIKNPMLFYPTFIVASLLSAFYIISPKRKEFLQAINEKVKKDELDIKERVQKNAAGRI